jgi:hypothetical protein
MNGADRSSQRMVLKVLPGRNRRLCIDIFSGPVQDGLVGA